MAKGASHKEPSRDSYLPPPLPPATQTVWQKARSDVKTAIAMAGGVCVLSAITAILIPNLALWLGLSVLYALAAFMIADRLHRFQWERSITAQTYEIIKENKNMKRAVSRNQTEVAMLKSGLARAAAAIQSQARRLPPSQTIESQMMATLTEQIAYASADITQTDQVKNVRPLPPPSLSLPDQTNIVTLQAAPPLQRNTLQDPDQPPINDRLLSRMLDRAIANDHFALYIQPVMKLPQRKIWGYELYTRLRGQPGQYLAAGHYLQQAQIARLLPQIDLSLLRATLDQIAAHDWQGDADCPLFLNISAHALADTRFMGRLAKTLSRERTLAARLVFELPQSDWQKLDGQTLEVISGLKQLGCRFSMDHVQSKLFDAPALASAGVRFLKLDAAWLAREAANGASGIATLRRLKSACDAAGIDIITEKMDDEETLKNLLDFDLTLGQGYLFAKPDHPAAWRLNKAA